MLWDIVYLVSTDTPLQFTFSLWGEGGLTATSASRSGRPYVRTECWLGRCLQLPSSGLLLSTVQVSRRPWLNPLPADPQEPKCCTIQDKTQSLLWKHLSSVIGSWADEPLSRELIFMRRVYAMTHCPHAQLKAQSRMELGLTFQLVNPKQKSNPKSWSARRKPSLHEEPVHDILLSCLL